MIWPSALLAVMTFISLFGEELPVVCHGGPAELVKKNFAITRKLPAPLGAAILLGCAQGIMQSVNGVVSSRFSGAAPDKRNILNP